MSSVTNIPSPANEPVLAYAPGSAERKALKDTLRDMAGVVEDIPVVIGGEERRGEATTDLTSPHRHRHVLGRVHQADRKAADDAARAAVAAQREWAAWKLEDRAAIAHQSRDALADLDASREHDDFDGGMGDEFRSEDLGIAGNHVEHAGR